MHAWRRRFMWLFVTFLVLATLYGGLCWKIGSDLMSPAHRPVGSPPDTLPVRDINIERVGGGQLAAWYAENANSRGTIIVLHALRGNRGSMADRGAMFFEHGYSVLLVDLQAHGESAGQNITAGYRESLDVLAIVECARRLQPKNKVAIVGWSLGGAATLLASPLGVDAIVIEAVYPTIEQGVHNRVRSRLGPLHHLVAPCLLVQLKPRLGVDPGQLRPIDFVDKVECPILIAAGDLDVHTKIDETRSMFQAANEPKRLCVFDGAAHEDLFKFDSGKYSEEVLGFLKPILEPNMERLTNATVRATDAAEN